MSQLALYLLGPPHVELDGRSIHIGRRKAMALLAYLVVAGPNPVGRGHRRDSLATLLWPEHDQSSARAELRRTLSVLRTTLAGEWLEADRESIALNPIADVWSDVEQFGRLLLTWQEHGHPEADVCPRCLPPLTEAVELYRQDFLVGFSLRDSPNFDEWQFFQAEGLRRGLTEALKKLVGAFKAEEAFELAVEFAHRWLSLDELNEQAHRQLMQLYARTGQRNAAIRQYQECLRILDKELGLPPEEDTAALCRSIQAGWPSRAVSPDLLHIMVPQVRTAPRHNLPQQTTPFIGRRAELDEIARLLQNPDCRMLTLLGPGGIGKTRLASQAAAEHMDAFTHGVFFVPLAPLRSTSSVIPAIAASLGLAFRREGDLLKGQLLNYLREKHLLLLMDSFEHLVERAGLLGEISAQTAGVKLLVTSRERLNLQGEWVMEIGGMRFPEAPPARLQPDSAQISRQQESIESYGAVQLFLQSAGRVRVGFALTEAECPAVTRIAQFVEGMPLALELAAAWVNVLSCEEIAAEIKCNLDFLETTLRDVAEPQRSMRAVFGRSWNLLSEREQQVFQQLSVFHGGFARRAGEKIVGVSLHELMSLVGKSLLQRSTGGRFDMHPLLRQYAAEKLEEDLPVWERTHIRHSDYYCAALREWGEALKGPQQRQVLAEIESDVENARAACEWATAHRQEERLDDTIEGLCLFLYRQARYEEGEAICRVTAAALTVGTAGDEQPVLARLLAWQGWFNLRLERSELAGQLFQKSLAWLENSGLDPQQTRSERAFVLMLLGEYYWRFSVDPEKGIRLLQQSLALYQELDDQWWNSELTESLAGFSWSGLGISAAERFYKKQLEIKRARGDLSGVANLLHELARFAAYVHGDLGEAERLYRESSEIFQELNNPASVVRFYECLDNLLIFKGRFAKVLELRQGSLAVYEDLGDRTALGHAYAHIGEAYHMLGDYEAAEAHGRAALIVLQKVGIRDRAGLAHWFLGLTLLAEGKYAEAKEFLQISAALWREQKHSTGGALAGLGRTELALGNRTRALEHTLEALQSLVVHPFRLLYAVATMALLLADQGEVVRAVELYSLVAQQPFVANSVWFTDVYGQHIEAAAAKIPPDVVAEAQERGRARDLKATAAELLIEMAC